MSKNKYHVIWSDERYSNDERNDTTVKAYGEFEAFKEFKRQVADDNVVIHEVYRHLYPHDVDVEDATLSFLLNEFEALYEDHWDRSFDTQQEALMELHSDEEWVNQHEEVVHEMYDRLKEIENLNDSR